ncbi:Protein-lysine N-methyltransferase efm4 [Mucor velutinosus]|uniref:Protein-lysine N-methyltransferase efm4 n=1 Tax=Mucor velutinosus TaxID=708070 RepID=A0AAN7DDP4_9FUNG|nr:Protein-lysine N-methyltransferase efm4 [Mucor velutinosus]
MSSGDTPPVRFTTPSSASTSTKKYPGKPKSPMLSNSNIGSSNNSNTNAGNRNLQARQRLLSSKISAPRPINLPSLRREHAKDTDVPVSSPAPSHGWGSASSPSLSQQQQHIEPEVSEKKHDAETTHDKSSKPSDTSATSPVLIPATASASSAKPTRAWAVPAITQTKVPPSTDFPTAAEAASGTKKKLSLIDDKEYLKYASSDPNHRSWDEMVSEDMDDFSVDVVEFDDGTKVQVGSDASSVGSHTSASRTTEPVLPSERFTDDYDRSYPPKQPYHHPPPHHQQHHHQHHDNDPHHTNYKPYRRSEDYGYSSRYSNTNYNSRRHSSAMDGGNERRTSGTSDRRGAASSTTASTRRESTDHQPHYGHRRPSYDRKYDNGSYHPTSLLQRPRRLSEQSFRSDHSREEISNANALHIIPEPINATTESTEEIIVVQKNLMLTAAERAKKRREEQEAEFKAAAERAKQKADALAAKQAELKEKTILKKPAAASADTTQLKKTAVSPSSASAATNKGSVKASPTPTNATATPAPKAPLPPKLPDTSKPWNLVAANKQIPPTTTTTAVPSTSSAGAAAAAPNETNQSKQLPLQAPEEPSSTPSKESQPTQILKNEEQKPVTMMKKEPKPAPKEEKAEQVDEKKEDNKAEKPLTEDEKTWRKFVSTVRTDQQAAVKKDVTSGDWNSYANRLQETTAEQDAIAATARERLIREVEKEIQLESQQHKQQQPQAVEVYDYEHESWGAPPVSLMNGRNTDRGAWTREDHAYNQQRGQRNGQRSSGRGGRSGGGGTSSMSRDTGRTSNQTNAKNRTTTHSTDHWRHDTTAEEQEEKEQKPVVVEILKKQEPVLSKKTRLTNLLKESSSPIFPDFIDKLAAKKPANMSFMVEMEESDKEIAMIGQDTITAAVEDDMISVATTHTTTTENSPASTPPKSQFPSQQQQQQRRLNVNRHFPVLVYQYPTAQSATTTTAGTLDHPSSPSSSMDIGPKSPLSHHQQSPQNRPLGVYLMPQQPFLTRNQYVVPYPQVGTSNAQPVYYPTLSWQQQQQQQQHANVALRPAYEHHLHPSHHRRPYNTTYNDYLASNGYRQHTYPHNSNVYQNASNGRGNSHRKRGGGAAQSWSGSMMNNAGVGRGHHQTTHNSNHNKKYSRHDTDAAANEPPSSAVDIQQPSL